VKVKLTVSRAGDGFVQKPGDIIDVSSGEAARLLASGAAKPVLCDGVDTIEHTAETDEALARTVETAAMDTAREMPTAPAKRTRKRVKR